MDGVGPAAYSKNHGGVYGKYMFDKKTFAGEFNYDRNTNHYYGYNSEDSILDKDPDRTTIQYVWVKAESGIKSLEA
ncbi:MAG: hypothetical protein IPH33_07755 [Bacteroidetes bacterium]|nr:hypothetical protein [Bacteroidota bacterium]